MYIVAGIPTPLKSMSSSVGMMKISQYMQTTCSKPPTSLIVWLFDDWFVSERAFEYVKSDQGQTAHVSKQTSAKPVHP